ncbi:spermidine/putrescine ABC transporter permease [Halobacteriales archaeon QS_6_64_34]|nr:MAG: spermidine/putrescine ABC transporter permease [Halobacteriales archaeon QS_6_64_34]
MSDGRETTRSSTGEYARLETKRGSGRDRLYQLLLNSYTSLVIGFVLLPLVVISLMSFTPSEFLRFPPEGLSLRWYREFFDSRAWLVAMQNSLFIAIAAAVGATSIGATAAFALDRYDYRFEMVLTGLSILPILLPPVIIGVAFVTLFGLLGVGGEPWTLAVAHSIFFSPFPFVLVSQGLGDIDRSYEEAAADLGAAKATVIRRITVPLLRANLFAGALFAFILSLNEYIISWLISGFSFKTIPIQIFTSLRYSYSPVIAAVSLLFIVMTVVVMLMVDRFAGGMWK